MSQRAALAAGQTVELFGRIYTWRRVAGRWSLELDRLETPRRELLTALERRAAEQRRGQAQAAADRGQPGSAAWLASLVAASRAVLAADATRRGDPAFRPAAPLGGFRHGPKSSPAHTTGGQAEPGPPSGADAGAQPLGGRGTAASGRSEAATERRSDAAGDSPRSSERPAASQPGPAATQAQFRGTP